MTFVFRVDYSNSEDLAKLCEAVSNKALGSVDRLNILDDLFRYEDYTRDGFSKVLFNSFQFNSSR